MNITTLLAERGAEFGSRPAIIHGDRSISFEEFHQAVIRRAAWYRSKGIGKGDGVLIVVPMSIELYQIMIALMHIGAVAVFLDAWSDRQRLEAAGKIFPMKGFIALRKAHLLRFVSSSLRTIPLKFGPGLPDRWQEVLVDPVAVDENDPALITFTTGSTGPPKGANRTHRFLLAQQRAIHRHFQPRSSDVDMATLPIFPLSNLAVGATTLLPSIDFRRPMEADPAIVLDEMRRHHVTTTAGSPAFYLRLAEEALKSGRELPDLRDLFVGGAPLSPRGGAVLSRAFPSTRVVLVYGATEVEPVSMIDLPSPENHPGGLPLPNPPDPLLRGLPVGYPVDSVDVMIRPIDNEEGDDTVDRVQPEQNDSGRTSTTQTWQPGEICVSGDHVLSSYVGPVDTSDRYVEEEGKLWLRTGDAGLFDPEGGLVLLGRVARRLRIDGRSIYVLPVELLLEQVEGVAIGTIIEGRNGALIVIEREPDGLGKAHGKVRDQADQLLEKRVHASLASLDLAELPIRVVNQIPRDPRHASKIDYLKLIGMINGGES